MSAFDGLDGGLKALTFDYNEIRPRAASVVFGIWKRAMAAPTTKQIEIVVNGQVRLAPQGCTLRQLLVWLEVDPERIAVELNRSIVQRQAWDQATVGPGATLEIVQFVGGG
jgi:thiamine biosynthesis protein ThiS